MKHVYVIDDTGSPGNSSESVTLKSDRKTYVAVLIASDIRDDLLAGIRGLLMKYGEDDSPLPEFHFTDLLNRRKVYRDFNSITVTAIFKDFSTLLNGYSLPYFVQSMTPRTMAENGMQDPMNRGVEELALEFLYMRIKIFEETFGKKDTFEIIVDEGFKKRGQVMVIDRLKDLMTENIATFKTSHDFLLLQVADFFAFVINRNQMLAIKDSRTTFDREILEIANTVFQGNASSGSAGVMIHKDFSSADYDRYQIEKRKTNGIYPFWKKVNKPNG